MAEQRSERELEKHLKTLKGQRTWKKGAITKRIKKLESMVNDGGRRTLIRAAVDGLLTVFDELNQVCASIAAMSEEVDDLNSVEEIRMEVEMCVAMANEDLDARKDDPPSTEDDTSEWVNQHAGISGAGSNAPSEMGRRYENYTDEYILRSEEVSHHSGNISNTFVRNSPLHPVDLPVQSHGTGTGAAPYARNDINSVGYGGVAPGNVNIQGYDNHTSHGGQQDVRLRPFATADRELVSYGVYDDNSICELRGKYDTVDMHHDVNPWHGHSGWDPHTRENSSLPDLHGKDGRFCEEMRGAGSLPDVEKKTDRLDYREMLGNGSVMTVAQRIDRGLRISDVGNVPVEVSSRNERSNHSEMSGINSDFISNRITTSISAVPVRSVESDRDNGGNSGIAVSGRDAGVPTMRDAISSRNEVDSQINRIPSSNDISNREGIPLVLNDQNPVHTSQSPITHSAAQRHANGLQSAQRRETVVISGNPPPPGLEGVGSAEKRNNRVGISGITSGELATTPQRRHRSNSVARDVPSTPQNRRRTVSVTSSDLDSWYRRVQNHHPISTPANDGSVSQHSNSGGRIMDQQPDRDAPQRSTRDVQQNYSPRTAVYRSSNGMSSIPQSSVNNQASRDIGKNNGNLTYTRSAASSRHSSSSAASTISDDRISVRSHGSSHSSHESDSVPERTHGGHKLTRSPLIRNEVDSWIDELDVSKSNTSLNWTKGGVDPNSMMTWMVQQHLPKAELPTFDGSAGDWVDFITKFRDLVHLQDYLNDGQRIRLLLQQLKGEASRAVKGFANDSKGYVLALQKIKQLFGQRAMVAQAVISKVTKGKVIQNDDFKGLSELLYSINDCLITLTQLNYESDLHSS